MIEFIINNFLTFSLILFISSGIVSLLPNAYQRISHLITTILTISGATFGLIYSLVFFFNGEASLLNNFTIFGNFEIVFSINKISAIFLSILFFVTITSVLFGYSYVKHYFGKYKPGLLSLSLNSFILSMIAVVLSQSVYPFLFFWEMMSITSFMIIIFENNKEKNVKAGLLYLMFTQIGFLFIMAAFLLLSQSAGSQYFGQFFQANETIKIIASILLIIGFGAKAGLIPFHIWLPEAHPAAPSHASAIISGVMLKIALFAMIEFFLFFIPVNTPWIGIILIILGVVTAVFGSMYALVMTDIKKLIAYSSIDNVGIITLFLGLVMFFVSLSQQYYDNASFVQSFTGARQLTIIMFLVMIFHIINHSVYKSALFQTTGVINNVFGTRKLDYLGGIAKAMPLFSILFVIFTLSISAIPPFNGFASEWLGLQSMIGGIINAPSTDIATKLLLLTSAAALIVTGAFTAAAFVKAIGVGFLGVNRENKNIEEHKKHVGTSIYVSLIISAITVTFLGVFANYVVYFLNSQLFPSVSSEESSLFAGSNSISVPIHQANLSNMFIFIILLSAVILVILVTGLWKTRIKKYLTWDCGRDVNPRMQYSSVAFSDNIRMTFASFYFPRKSREVEDEKKYKFFHYLPNKIFYHDKYLKVYEKYLYHPLSNFILRLGNTVKKVQTGMVNTYLIYILVTLIIILLIVIN
ncbi:MAG: proton-conducting transporter membrane subunit [bacterium]